MKANTVVRLLSLGGMGIVGLGLASQAQAETVNVVLRLQAKVPMSQLAANVNDPHSDRYQKFYTPEEIRQIAGPTDAEYADLLANLQKQGIGVIGESKTHLFVTVTGDRSAFTALQSQARMADVSSSLVASVHGLVSGPKRKPHIQFRAKQSGGIFSELADFNGFSPDDIKTLYNFGPIYQAGITGAGQHIAIATYDGFYIQDVKDYYTKNNITPGPAVDQVQFNGAPTYSALSAAETQTDAEFSGMIAPGASIHVFASAANSDEGEVQLFTAIMDDNRSKVVNYSWGSCEKELAADHKTAMDALYAQAVAQGINVVVASGDSGSDCEQDGSTVADFPASNPDVIAVGGTTLADNNGVASETAWSGSGGGISALYAKPNFQANLPAVFTNRAYPDVAFNADPNSGEPTWVHYNPNSPDGSSPTASYVVIGGTSIAAPQWSGFLTLVGQARQGRPLGAFNLRLYAIAQTHEASFLNDITSGSNGAYSCGPGFSAVTGWGSMQAAALLSELQHEN